MATHHLKIAAVIQKTHNNSMSIHNNPSNRSSIFYCSGYSRGKEYAFYEEVVQIQTVGINILLFIPIFLKTGLAKKSTHSTIWQFKTISKSH